MLLDYHSEAKLVMTEQMLVMPCPGKEYSKGDSRYVARDTATVTVEGITAVLEGPASLLAVYDSLLIFYDICETHFPDVYSGYLDCHCFSEYPFC